jgi:hypothetical protein
MLAVAQQEQTGDVVHHFTTNLETYEGTKSIFEGMDAFQRRENHVTMDSVVLDSHYNLYVADCKNSIVYKYTPLGNVIEFGGQWSPCSLVVDSHDNVFVADKKGVIHKISSAGVISTFISQQLLDLSAPHTLAIDLSDSLYVMEERTTRIIKISATGQVSTFGRLPALTQEQHHAPEIAVDSRGWVFAFRKESGCIFVFNSQGILTEEIKTPEQLVPVKLAMDWDNNLYWTTADGAIVGLDGSDDAHHHALDHITQRHDLYRSNYSKRVETAQSAQQEQKEFCIFHAWKGTTRKNRRSH